MQKCNGVKSVHRTTETQRDTDTQRHRDTERQRDIQTHTQTHTQRHKHAHRQTHRDTHSSACCVVCLAQRLGRLNKCILSLPSLGYKTFWTQTSWTGTCVAVLHSHFIFTRSRPDGSRTGGYVITLAAEDAWRFNESLELPPGVQGRPAGPRHNHCIGGVALSEARTRTERTCPRTRHSGRKGQICGARWRSWVQMVFEDTGFLVCIGQSQVQIGAPTVAGKSAQLVVAQWRPMLACTAAKAFWEPSGADGDTPSTQQALCDSQHDLSLMGVRSCVSYFVWAQSS